MRAVSLLTCLALVSAPASSALAAHNRADPDALELLASVRKGFEHPHTGEVIQVVWDGESSQATLATVSSTGAELTVQAENRWTMRLAQRGAGLVDHTRGWHIPVPKVAGTTDDDPLRSLAAKYRPRLGPRRLVAGHSCRVVEVHERADARLREQLCISEQSGLVLRRQTYGPEGGLVRLAAYLWMEEGARSWLERPARTKLDLAPVPLVQHEQEVTPLEPQGLEALRRSGWTLPDALPGGYDAVARYLLTAHEGSPVHVVYRDGLYTVSLFEQVGHPDWDALPPGAQRARGLGWEAYEWPGALPQRLVWEADGFTYALVGDAPPDEFRAIAESLPATSVPDPGQRVRRGLARLWSFVTAPVRG